MGDLEDLFPLDPFVPGPQRLLLLAVCEKVLELVSGDCPGSQAVSTRGASSGSIRRKECDYEEKLSAMSGPPDGTDRVSSVKGRSDM